MRNFSHGSRARSPHRHRPVLRSLAAVVGVAALLSAGCSSDQQTLRVYSGRHYDVELAFTEFSKQTGINLEFLTGSDSELRERIAAEGENTQADVYITVDAGNLAAAAEEGLFQPLDSPVLNDAVPASMRDPDGYWYGLTLRARTVVYNPDKVAEDEVPDSYEELADPKWKGRVCLRDSSNVYTQSLVASLIAHHGEEEALRIVTGWADNAEILSNDVLILKTIAEGRCDVGITNHYYLGRLLEEDPNFPVKLHWVDQDGRGVHINTSGGGITKYADNPDLGQQFLEWLATDGQSLFVDKNHEYPINPDVTPEPLILNTFGNDFVKDELDASVFGGLNAEAIRVMDLAGYR